MGLCRESRIFREREKKNVEGGGIENIAPNNRVRLGLSRDYPYIFDGEKRPSLLSLGKVETGESRRSGPLPNLLWLLTTFVPTL